MWLIPAAIFNHSKSLPGNDINPELCQLRGVNQLDWALPLTGKEIGDKYFKLLNVVRDTREPVVLGGPQLWGACTVPIPDSASEIEFQVSDVLQGREILSDRLENVFIHVA